MIRKRLAAGRVTGSVAQYLIFILAGAWMLLPFFWMVSASFMSSEEVSRVPAQFLPSQLRWENYVEVSHVVPLARAYGNSLIVTGCSVLGILFTSSLCGYGLAKFTFRGRDLLLILILASMMIPGFVTLIPVFFIVKQLGWLDKYAGLILPGIVSAYGIFLMRQFMLAVPDDLIDAARIDGAGEFRIYWQVVLPLTRPAMATLGSFNFVGVWNSFLWPLLVAQSRELMTVPLALNTLRTYGASATVQHLQMAGTVVSVIPSLLVFVAMQRYFVQGIALTGLKG